MQVSEIGISKEAQRLLNTEVVKEYKDIMIKGLKSRYPLLHDFEIDQAVTWAIVNNYRNGPMKMSNNYTKQEINGTVIDILHYIQTVEPILTSSGVLYKKHKEAPNPLNDMIQGFLKQRKIFKKEMFKHPKGSSEFERYNLLQLLEKLNANATYGYISPYCVVSLYFITI